MSRLFHVKNPAPSGAGTRVFIAMPTGSGFLQCPTISSLLEAIPVFNREGIGYEVFIEAGNCHVDDTRNSAVREFMKTDCTDLFFLDADVGFDPESIARLLKLDRDIVAGVYPKKTDEEAFPVTVEPGTVLQAEADGCVEVTGAPTGFMRIRRNVIEAMLEKYKHRRFHGQAACEGDEPYTILFERTYEAGKRFSGDYAFCRKWREMGGKIYVDPELPFTHEGLKEWSGVLGDHWRDKHGITAARYQLAVERLKAGIDSPELFIWLYQGWGNKWSASPSMLAAVYGYARKASAILECGSGLTTIAMAAANPGVQIVSLEHDAEWAAKVRVHLERFGLSNAEVRVAPLDPETGWYKAEAFDADMVVIDGPPRHLGANRAHVLGLFERGIVFMDDTDDRSQLDALTSWAGGAEVITLGEGKKFSVVSKP